MNETSIMYLLSEGKNEKALYMLTKLLYDIHTKLKPKYNRKKYTSICDEIFDHLANEKKVTLFNYFKLVQDCVTDPAFPRMIQGKIDNLIKYFLECPLVVKHSGEKDLIDIIKKLLEQKKRTETATGDDHDPGSGGGGGNENQPDLSEIHTNGDFVENDVEMTVAGGETDNITPYTGALKIVEAFLQVDILNNQNFNTDTLARSPKFTEFNNYKQIYDEILIKAQQYNCDVPEFISRSLNFFNSLNTVLKQRNCNIEVRLRGLVELFRQLDEKIANTLSDIFLIMMYIFGEKWYVYFENKTAHDHLQQMLTGWAETKSIIEGHTPEQSMILPFINKLLHCFMELHAVLRGDSISTNVTQKLKSLFSDCIGGDPETVFDNTLSALIYIFGNRWYELFRDPSKFQILDSTLKDIFKDGQPYESLSQIRTTFLYTHYMKGGHQDILSTIREVGNDFIVPWNNVQVLFKDKYTLKDVFDFFVNVGQTKSIDIKRFIDFFEEEISTTENDSSLIEELRTVNADMKTKMNKLNKTILYLKKARRIQPKIKTFGSQKNVVKIAPLRPLHKSGLAGHSSASTSAHDRKKKQKVSETHEELDVSETYEELDVSETHEESVSTSGYDRGRKRNVSETHEGLGGESGGGRRKKLLAVNTDISDERDLMIVFPKQRETSDETIDTDLM